MKRNRLAAVAVILVFASLQTVRAVSSDIVMWSDKAEYDAGETVILSAENTGSTTLSLPAFGESHIAINDAAADPVYWSAMETQEIVPFDPGEMGGTVAGQIFWIEDNAIMRADPDGENVQEVLSEADAGQAVTLAIDRAADRIYYGTGINPPDFNPRIKSVDYDGIDIVDLLGGFGESSSGGIAVDSVQGKFYYTDPSDCDFCGSVRRADLDGSNAETVLFNIDFPVDIDVSSSLHSIWWTASGSIQTASLDGSGLQDLIGSAQSRGVAVDPLGAKIYWTDMELQRIRRAGLDGSGVEDLVSVGLDQPWGLALDLEEGKMYWTDRSAGKIQRANLDGSNVEDVLTGLGVLLAIDVDPSGLPGGADSCDDPAGVCDLALCEAVNSCETNADCSGSDLCLPYGTPGVPCGSSSCYCELDGTWTCSDDCAPQCVPPEAIPTISSWGVMIMMLLLVGLAAILFRRVG